MSLKPIYTQAQHEAALAWVEVQLNAGVLPHSPAGKKLQVVLLLIQQYEEAHFPVLPKES